MHRQHDAAVDNARIVRQVLKFGSRSSTSSPTSVASTAPSIVVSYAISPTVHGATIGIPPFTRG